MELDEMKQVHSSIDDVLDYLDFIERGRNNTNDRDASELTITFACLVRLRRHLAKQIDTY